MPTITIRLTEQELGFLRLKNVSQEEISRGVRELLGLDPRVEPPQDELDSAPDAEGGEAFLAWSC